MDWIWMLNRGGGYSPLQEAIFDCCQKNVLFFLIDKIKQKAEINPATLKKKVRFYEIESAIEYGFFEVVEKLIDAGVVVSQDIYMPKLRDYAKANLQNAVWAINIIARSQQNVRYLGDGAPQDVGEPINVSRFYEHRYQLSDLIRSIDYPCCLELSTSMMSPRDFGMLYKAIMENKKVKIVLQDHDPLKSIDYVQALVLASNYAFAKGKADFYQLPVRRSDVPFEDSEEISDFARLLRDRRMVQRHGKLNSSAILGASYHFLGLGCDYKPDTFEPGKKDERAFQDLLSRNSILKIAVERADKEMHDEMVARTSRPEAATRPSASPCFPVSTPQERGSILPK